MNYDLLSASPELICGALKILRHIRAVSVPVLSEEFRLALLEEAKQYPLRYIRNVVGSEKNKVYQEMDLQTDLNQNGLFGMLVSEFQTLFNDAVEGESLFDDKVVFNDWILQRYVPGSGGITPHRDRNDYRHLICIFVLAGRGRFFISDDRQKLNQQEIVNLPGNVILMPGPGFSGLNKRPFHYLQDITEERWVFGLRHDETKLICKKSYL